MGRKAKQPKDKLHTVGLTVPVSVKKELLKLAGAKGSVSAIARQLVEEALQTRKEKAA